MKRLPAWLAAGALGAALVGGALWWWDANMEQRSAVRQAPSDAARADPLLAATLLLRQHQHAVAVKDNLFELGGDAPPDGTLILPRRDGIIPSADADRLLAWVRRGNTLVFWPRKLAPDAEPGAARGEGNPAGADTPESNPFGARLGVSVSYQSGERAACAPPGTPVTDADTDAVSHACIRLPGKLYLTLVRGDSAQLATVSGGRAPSWGDEGQQQVRVYAEGKGQLVALAGSYFDNEELVRYDHAEFLLGLTALNGPGAAVTFVRELNAVRWWRALWLTFRPALISLACFLLLLLWRGATRFGPLLPEPDQARRSVIEHIDASATWLWTLPGGREILLAAARHATHTLLARRIPELARLPPDQQLSRLCALCPLPAAELGAALYQPAASVSQQFSRQVRTLSELRKYYER